MKKKTINQLLADNGMLTAGDIWLVALAMVGTVACSYLAGEDAAMDDISYAERLRVVCAMPGHSESLCHNKAQGRDETH